MGRFVEGADRSQLSFLPECLEDWVDEDNPVQVIEAFVEALDLPALGFDGATPANTGRPAYHPAVLLKLYIYGYLNRVQSSRRLEREAGRNVELMWLTRPAGARSQDDRQLPQGQWPRHAPGLRPLRCALPPDGPARRRHGRGMDGSKFKAVNNRDRNFTHAKMARRWRRSRRASRATCISSTAPTGRSRARRSPPRWRGSRRRSAELRQEMDRLAALDG